MSDLTFVERTHLEKLFKMGGGYVLDFTDRTMGEFVADAVRKDIYDQKYRIGSGSKANCMRGFWRVEPNHIVGDLIQQLIEYASTLSDVDHTLILQARAIAKRLLGAPPVSDLDAIDSEEDDRTIEALARAVREAIDNNRPDAGLDRLHTFTMRFIRKLCAKAGITSDRDKPLHSLFGEYIKHLRADGLIESAMTERILKMSISTLEAFNTVRNEESLAHDNAVLNYDESLFIYNHVCALVRFLKAIEQQREEG